MLSSRFISKISSLVKTYGPTEDIKLIINTDSRSFKKGETFVALHGDNFDGFNYVEQVIKLGAKAIIYTRKENRDLVVKSYHQNYPDILFIETTDSLKCIQELASLYILEWRSKKDDRKIIGITGSNGKTTHKEMLSWLLNTIFPNQVLATRGNLNNHIGVPLTIFDLKDHHQIAVIEMGMNHQGEIKELCAIAHPEHGIITNIGSAHIEFMQSVENILKEKASLYQAVLENTNGLGKFVVNADDNYLMRLEKSPGLTTYGEKKGDIKITITEHKIKFQIFEQDVLITNKNILEHYNLKNLAGTAILAMELFPNKIKEIALAANAYEQPSMNRSQWVNNIFLDAYNANPSSMRVSIDSFVNIMKQKAISLDDCYFILGDMNELGVFAEELHREIAEHVKSLGIQNISFIGRYRNFYEEGFKDPKSSHLLKEEFYEEWKYIRKTYKFVFMKASRSLQLESLMSIV